MASQYNLQLKAILDTTQVKRELQKLRTLQQQALGKGNQNTSNVQNGSNNLGNLNALNSTLGRLTSSINQLNTAITKLSVLTKTQSVQTTGVHTTNAFANIAQLRGMNNISQTISKGFDSPIAGRWLELSPETGKWIEMRKPAAPRPAAPRPAAPQPAPLTAPTFQLTPDMKRMMAGMAFGQGAAAFTRIGETTFGWDKETTAAVGGIGKIGAYAAAGSAAGPWGTAIGAVVGGLELIADVCTAQAENLQQALATAAERIRSAVVVDTAVNKHFTTERDELALKTKDEKYFKNVIARERSKKREAQDWISWNIGRGPNAIERWEKETERLVAMDNKYNQPRIDRRNAIADRYRENANTMIQSDARIKQAQAMLEQIKAQKKAEEDAKKGETDKQKAIEDAKKQQELIAIKNIDSSIGGERTQIKLFGEHQSNQELLKLGNADAVKAKRDQYKKQTDTARENYLYYLDKAEKATTAQEKQEAYEIAMKSKDRWNFDKSQLDMLNTALPQLLVAPLQDALSKLTPPSMENVNSLAGQGLMINRKDDYAREQIMEDYQREQTELQRQIKDILQQDEHGSTESIIW